MTIHTGERLAKLRELMRKEGEGVDVYVVPSEDQHGSEYIAACDERRAFISGFNGSAGCAVITMEKALMFTDGRYFLQAEQQMDENWTLMKQGLPGVPTWQDYLTSHLSQSFSSSSSSSIRIGIDPTLIPYSEAQSLSDKLTKNNASLVPINDNLVDQVWGSDRPARTKNAVFRLEEKFTGESSRDKLARLREAVLGSSSASGSAGSAGSSASSTSNSGNATSTSGSTPASSAAASGSTTAPTTTKGKGPKALVLTALDDIAWLFNLRGSDIDYNPVFFAYAVVHFHDASASSHPDVTESRTKDAAETAVNTDTDTKGKTSAVLFLQRDHVDQKSVQAVRDELGLDEEVEVRAYEDVWGYLKELGSTLKGADKDIEERDKPRDAKDSEKEKEKEKLVLIPDRASLAIAKALGESIIATPAPPTSSHVATLKSIKNETELDGFRNCHVRDGIALARYFAWLEETLCGGGGEGEGKGKEEVSEWGAAEVLERYRSELPLFKGLSFDTISSTGPNGAIIHYSPDPKDCAVIKKDQIYLCDSGAQFLDGTTDVTRTWHFGTPTAEEKRTATRVLQGHIAIDEAVFPNGTTGYIIDSWARKPLWKDGLDFRHGTGHGVGHFLNVHEGPHGIGMRITSNSHPLKAGMTVTNEPGYYADGKYGVRIENVLLVKEVKPETGWNFGDKGWLGFECVTMCPIQTKLVDEALLSVDEKRWLNEYHKRVWEKVSPGLKEVGDERALKWLERECKEI